MPVLAAGNAMPASAAVSVPSGSSMLCMSGSSLKPILPDYFPAGFLARQQLLCAAIPLSPKNTLCAITISKQPGIILKWVIKVHKGGEQCAFLGISAISGCTCPGRILDSGGKSPIMKPGSGDYFGIYWCETDDCISS